MRTPSTPEIAFDNVQLEADFVQRATELRTMRNSQLNDVRSKRVEYKNQARRDEQTLRHEWAIEHAALRCDLEKLKDVRASLRQQMHDAILERDTEQLFDLTEQIRKMQEHIANRELAHNERLNELHAKLQQNLNDLSKLNIEIQAEFRRQHSKLRQELADKIDVNRQRAIELQKGNLS